MQTKLEMEGYFAIKITPLGGSLCLLEETEEGLINDFIGVGESWWRQCFEEVKKWEEDIIDDGRVIWIREFGIPTHAWNTFFCCGRKFFGKLHLFR